jgi:four helix bundle protein
MNKKSPLHTKSFDFANRIVKAYKYLLETKKEYILSKQLIRSGTAIGALVKESEFAESKLDFIHKLRIALKEANETRYWLELLYVNDFFEKSLFDSLIADCEELIKLLIAIINKTKSNL